MATCASYEEEEYFSIYWKIKNFSYFFDGRLKSPEFNFSVYQYWFYLQYGSEFMNCSLDRKNSDPQFNLTRQLSFLTCDGSSEESISGIAGTSLKEPKEVIFGSRRNAFLPDDTLTVRLRYLSNERGNIFISSQIGVKFKYFIWTLKDFSKNESTLTKKIEKSVSYGDIKLNIKQNGGNKTEKQFHFVVIRNGGEKCCYTLKMSILDSEGNSLNEICDEHVFEKENCLQERMFPLFFKKKKMLACENLVLSGDTLTIKCNFAISLGTLADQALHWYCEDVTPFINDLKTILSSFKGKTDSDFMTELQSNLKNILECGTLTDVSLKIDTEVIKVHKFILSARSPVFKAMFTKDMQETINNTVVIEDLDLETVRGLVLYMYTDTIPECSWENISKLYSAADKYEILTLKNICIAWLETNLSILNVCEILLLADLHEDVILKAVTFDFISEHGLQVFSLDAWKKIEETNSKLALEVMRKIWSKKHILN